MSSRVADQPSQVAVRRFNNVRAEKKSNGNAMKPKKPKKPRRDDHDHDPQGTSTTKRRKQGVDAAWNAVTLDDEGRVKVKGGNGYTPWASNLFPFQQGGGTYGEAPPLRIACHGRVYSSLEAAYQGEKASFFDERLLAEYGAETHLFDSFPQTIGAMEAKKAGGKGEGSVPGSGFKSSIWKQVGTLTKKRAGEVYDEILKKNIVNWYQVSVHKMRGLLAQKYGSDNPMFRDLLLSTGDVDIYEQRFRGGTVWEKGGSPSGLGYLGDLLCERRGLERALQTRAHSAQCARVIASEDVL